jgi:hypothetical protein
MNILLTIFNTNIAAHGIITNNNLMSRRTPIVCEEFVLRFFIPRSVLCAHNITISPMMNSTGKFHITDFSGTFDNFHNKYYAMFEVQHEAAQQVIERNFLSFGWRVFDFHSRPLLWFLSLIFLFRIFQ